MPYVSGTGLISDVFYSKNVFVNNVSVALWNKPQQSAAFVGDITVGGVAIDPLIVEQITSNDTAYTENPSVFAMPADAVSQGAIQPNYQGTPPQISTATGVITTATFTSGIIPFLAERLVEAGNGQWSRTYQTTGVDNPNIIGIWQSLGLGAVILHDTTPWCMGFVNFTLKQCGYKWCPEAGAIAIENAPSRWNAMSIPLDQGQPGDIALWNYSGHNHVNFIYTVQNGRYTFVGGNQNSRATNNNNPSDSTVSIAWPGGWTQASNKPGSTLVGLWRPSQT